MPLQSVTYTVVAQRSVAARSCLLNNHQKTFSILEAERQKHKSLEARGRVDSADFFEQDPIELAAFVHGYFKTCNEEQEV